MEGVESSQLEVTENTGSFLRKILRDLGRADLPDRAQCPLTHSLTLALFGLGLADGQRLGHLLGTDSQWRSDGHSLHSCSHSCRSCCC